MSGMRDPADDAPESCLSFEEEEEIKHVNRIVHDLHRQMNPSPIIGYATEHSIEDPFTGDITVTVQLA
jgi:hypothetical protein